MDLSTTFLTLFSAALGAVFSFWTQKNIIKQKFNFEIQTRELEINYESRKHIAEKLEAKIEEAHILASEIGREFSLTFMNVDWETKMSVSEYDEKYRFMCDRCSRLEMIVDLNFPHLSENVRELSGGMNLYWGNFRNVLHQTHAGKSPSELGFVFDNTVKISREVPEIAYTLKCELSEYYQSKY